VHGYYPFAHIYIHLRTLPRSLSACLDNAWISPVRAKTSSVRERVHPYENPFAHIVRSCTGITRARSGTDDCICARTAVHRYYPGALGYRQLHLCAHGHHQRHPFAQRYHPCALAARVASRCEPHDFTTGGYLSTHGDLFIYSARTGLCGSQTRRNNYACARTDEIILRCARTDANNFTRARTGGTQMALADATFCARTDVCGIHPCAHWAHPCAHSDALSACAYGRRPCTHGKA
jgi:hypothetical protein